MPVERIDMGGYTLIENAPLATRNTLRVNARARLLAEINDAYDDLRSGAPGRGVITFA